MTKKVNDSHIEYGMNVFFHCVYGPFRGTPKELLEHDIALSDPTSKPRNRQVMKIYYLLSESLHPEYVSWNGWHLFPDNSPKALHIKKHT